MSYEIFANEVGVIKFATMIGITISSLYYNVETLLFLCKIYADAFKQNILTGGCK